MRFREHLRMLGRIQMLPVLESGEETLIGGQAVMEGVMMRSPHSYCIAVRKPDGTVATESKPLEKVSERYPIFKYPVLRGLGTLGQAMKLGFTALQFSANIAAEALLPASTVAVNAMAPGCVAAGGDEAKGTAAKKEGPFNNWIMGIQLAFSILFFIVAYKLVPLWITERITAGSPELHGRFAFNFIDGVIRIAIFLTFLYAMSRMKDIRRVFEYHGAEHRVVFNFESGKPVDIPTAQSFQTFHPRCGTSFLITVMIISMVVYTVLPFDSFSAKLLSRIVLIPLIAGLSYEIIRFAAKRQGSLLALLTAPGLWLQRITTKNPTDDQTEIAIVALRGAMELEQKHGGELVIA
ncbi:MAG: DUF1385 domain-containing protein [Bryobacteraceae bacterium]